MNSGLRISFIVVASLVHLQVSTRQAVAVIVASGDIIMDGVQNPFAGSGVTLVDNVYTFPDEFRIGAASTVYFYDPNTFSPNDSVQTPSLSWVFPSGVGGLTFEDSTSLLDINYGERRGTESQFTLDMNNNNIGGLVAGAGKFINGPYVTFGEMLGAPMNVVINSQANVSIGEFNLSKKDSFGGGVTISAEGTVNVGSILNSDFDAGGNAPRNVDVTGKSVTLGSIDTSNHRSTGPSTNGNISITALAPPNYSTTNAAGNLVAENVVTLNGPINTHGALDTHTNGNLTVVGAKVVLGTGFSADIDPDSTFSVRAGIASGGFTQASVFVNNSPAMPTSVNYNVFHDGISPTVAVWSTNSSGIWSGTSNWDIASPPNSNTQIASFASAVTSPQTAFVNAPALVKGIQFDTPYKMAIGGIEGITLDADAGSASIEVLQGSHEIQVPLALADNTTISAANGTQLDVNNAIALGGNTLTIAGAGQVRLNHLVTGGMVVNSGSGFGAGSATSIGGDLISTGTLNVEIGGGGAADFGSFIVSGDALVSGLLSVDVAPGTMINAGDTFTVLAANSLEVNGLGLAGSGAGLFDILVDGTSLSLMATSSVPEPTSILLIAMIGVCGRIRRRNR